MVENRNIFKVGDCVMLKSDNQRMIIQFIDFEKQNATCVWKSKQKIEQKAIYNFELLKRCSSESDLLKFTKLIPPI